MTIFLKLDYRHIYVMGNTRYPFRYKIGVAKNVALRKQGIDSSMKGTVYEIYSVRVFFAQRIEQLLHLLYAPLSAGMRGSGKTEWFWMVIPVSPILLLMFIWIVQWLLIPLLIVGGIYFFDNVVLS